MRVCVHKWKSEERCERHQQWTAKLEPSDNDQLLIVRLRPKTRRIIGETIRSSWRDTSLSVRRN